MEIQFDFKGDPEGGRITNCMSYTLVVVVVCVDRARNLELTSIASLAV
jgi:hypothetical protein